MPRDLKHDLARLLLRKGLQEGGSGMGKAICRSEGTCWAALVAIVLPGCMSWKPMPLDQLATAKGDRLRVVVSGGEELELENVEVRGHHLYGRRSRYSFLHGRSVPSRRVRVDLRAVQSAQKREPDEIQKAAAIVVGALGAVVIALVVAVVVDCANSSGGGFGPIC